MRAVISRVREASVWIEGEQYSAIKSGLLVLLASETGDSDSDIGYIVDKTVHLRIFEDRDGKMNCSLAEIGGEILLVSQFTLMGDARKGRRPSFIKAGSPEDARGLFGKAEQAFRQTGIPISTGIFQADMQVHSVNDGPVTILLDSKKTF